jgi:hypothetical protein
LLGLFVVGGALFQPKIGAVIAMASDPGALPVICLPAQFKGLTLSKVAADVIGAAGAEGVLPDEIAIDFSRLNFIRPAGVVFLSNLIWWLHRQGTTVRIQGTGSRSDAINFLDDSLFFEQHCGRKLRTFASPRQTTRPLVQIAHHQSHDWLQHNLVPWLAAQLGITEASLYSFKNCAAELFNNIQDHTNLEVGSIFVQHFPREHLVTIAVSDFGPGIPAKVREKLPDLSDSQAIVKAVEEGFTTKSSPANRGIGLDYLLKTVVLTNGGQVTIYSGESIVTFANAGTNIRPVVFRGVGFCPGTTIDLILRVRTIEVLPDDSEDLTW